MFTVNDLYKKWCEQTTKKLINGNHSNNFYLRKIASVITGKDFKGSHSNNFYLRRLGLHYCEKIGDVDEDNYYLRCMYKVLVGSVGGAHSNHFYLTGIVTGDIGDVIEFPVVGDVYCLNDNNDLIIEVGLDYDLPLMIGLYNINGTVITTTTLNHHKLTYHIPKKDLQHTTYYLKVENKDYIGQSNTFTINKGVNLNHIQTNYKGVKII